MRYRSRDTLGEESNKRSNKDSALSALTLKDQYSALPRLLALNARSHVARRLAPVSISCSFRTQHPTHLNHLASGVTISWWYSCRASVFTLLVDCTSINVLGSHNLPWRLWNKLQRLPKSVVATLATASLAADLFI
jgi:hypothetical protein